MTPEESSAFREALVDRIPPDLKHCDYKLAVENYSFLVVRDTLTRLGYTSHQANSLSGSNRGNIRKRLESCLKVPAY